MTENNRLLSFLGVKDKIFYGWVIVAAALVISCFLVGTRFSFGIFFKSLETEFSLTRAATSNIFSAYMMFYAIFAFVSGWVLDKYGPRTAVILMGLITGLSLLITSQVTAYWQLFLSYSLLLSMGTSGGVAVLMSVVARWFDKKRGFAIGIAIAGAGLGTLIIAPFAAILISTLDWRLSYIILGTTTMLVVISMALLLRSDPSDIGALPDGVKADDRETISVASQNQPRLTGLSIMQALKTRSFWFLSAVRLLFSLYLNLLLTHIVPYATDAGIPVVQAATIISIMSVFNIIAKLLAGKISDKIGRKLPGTIASALGALSLIWLIWSHELWMFYVFAVIMGFAWGGLGLTLITQPTDIFRGYRLGSIMGALEVSIALGAAIGSSLGGFVFDATGGYTLAFIIGSIALLITIPLIAFTKQEPSN